MRNPTPWTRNTIQNRTTSPYMYNWKASAMKCIEPLPKMTKSTSAFWFGENFVFRLKKKIHAGIRNWLDYFFTDWLPWLDSRGFLFALFLWLIILTILFLILCCYVIYIRQRRKDHKEGYKRYSNRFRTLLFKTHSWSLRFTWAKWFQTTSSGLSVPFCCHWCCQMLLLVQVKVVFFFGANWDLCCYWWYPIVLAKHRAFHIHWGHQMYACRLHPHKRIPSALVPALVDSNLGVQQNQQHCNPTLFTTAQPPFLFNTGTLTENPERLRSTRRRTHWNPSRQRRLSWNRKRPPRPHRPRAQLPRAKACSGRTPRPRQPGSTSSTRGNRSNPGRPCLTSIRLSGRQSRSAVAILVPDPLSDFFSFPLPLWTNNHATFFFSSRARLGDWFFQLNCTCNCSFRYLYSSLTPSPTHKAWLLFFCKTVLKSDLF